MFHRRHLGCKDNAETSVSDSLAVGVADGGVGASFAPLSTDGNDAVGVIGFQKSQTYGDKKERKNVLATLTPFTTPDMSFI